MGKKRGRRGIERLVATYGDAVTRLDTPLWRTCWTDDATWLLGDRTATGIQAVVEQWSNATRALDFAAHVAFAVGIAVDGDRARGRWYVQEILKPREAGPMLLFGTYDDRYRCDDGVWRFEQRRFSFLFRSALPADGVAWFKVPKELDVPFGKPFDQR